MRAAADVMVVNHMPTRTSAPLTVAFFLTLLTTMSRGVLEVLIGKSSAYGIQVVAITMFLAILVLAGARSTKRLTANLIAAYVFLLAALASMAVSAAINGIDYAWPYVVVMVFFVLVIVAFNSFTFTAIHRIAIGPSVKVVAVLLVVTGLAQQYLRLSLLPGNDTGTFGSTLRPASLTGSFLHYPIALAILAFALMGIYAQTRRASYLVVALLSFAGVALSLSRSGLVLCAIGLAAGVMLMRGLGGKIRLLVLAAIGVLLLALVAPSDLFLSRALSIFEAEGAGNAVRLGQWSRLLDEWLASPLLIGNQTGVYTNVTANYAGIESSVAESSVLQQLINFGLVGLVAFYAVLIGSVLACPPEIPWFRAGLIGALVQSAFYQSVEVLPFMAAFALMPLLAARYRQEPDGTTPSAARGRPNHHSVAPELR